MVIFIDLIDINDDIVRFISYLAVSYWMIEFFNPLINYFVINQQKTAHVFDIN